jgi:hypothetical protein
MKKLFLSLVLLGGVVFSSQAQTEKGKFILGGNVSYNTTKTDAPGAEASHEFSIVPNIGYFVSDNIAIGTGIGYESQKASSPSLYGKTESFVVSPFGRYYVPVADKFHFFGQLSVPMAFGNTKALNTELEVGDKTGSSTSIGVALSPGFAFYPSSRIGIEFALNGVSYNDYSIEDRDGNAIKGSGNQSFSIGSDFFAPRLGIQFHF